MKASELPAVMIMWHAFCLLKRIMLISATPPPSTGDNVWVLVSTALVLMMCIPGLFLFYGGLVRSKNVLSIAAQCLALTAMGVLMWWGFGYSLVFGKSYAGSLVGHIFGGGEHFGFAGLGFTPDAAYAPGISSGTFALFQAMFAAITPALIIGAVAERMKFSAVMLFSFLWTIFVYYPVAHAVWGATGHFSGIANADAAFKAADFAGGIVVHMTSGWSALLLCILVGPRAGFGKRPMPPHSMVLCVIGTGLLWAGWYGFNAGSALAADGIALQAFMTTTLGAATATLAWAVVEKLHRGKISVLGLCSGAIAGLATVTPASGVVGPAGAILLGLISGLACYFACGWVKEKLKIDDSLDVFAVHGLGGIIGTVLLAVFGTASFGGFGKFETGPQLLLQLKAVGVTVLWSAVATYVIARCLKAFGGLRVSPENEETGLDASSHGEKAYHI